MLGDSAEMWQVFGFLQGSGSHGWIITAIGFVITVIRFTHYGYWVHHTVAEKRLSENAPVECTRLFVCFVLFVCVCCLCCVLCVVLHVVRCVVFCYAYFVQRCIAWRCVVWHSLTLLGTALRCLASLGLTWHCCALTEIALRPYGLP